MLERKRKVVVTRQYCDVYRNNQNKVLFKGKKSGLIATHESNVVNLDEIE
jgi:hypothetical protein